MGLILTHLYETINLVASTSKASINPSQKRGLEDELETIMSTPKKHKLNSTSEYIYKTLFKAGQDSDVTLVALGRNWPLHRVYLRQSPYFDSMFTGNWKESNDSVVHITITDENISVEALEISLGSLYCDELSVSGQQVVGVLATAVLLQLDALIQYCTAIMRQTINSYTLLHYYHVANRYGVVEVEHLCLQWLERCLLTAMAEHSSSLRPLPASMLQSAIASPNLFVIQTEFSVYVFLKMWLFLQLQPQFEGDHDAMIAESHKFFKYRKSGDKCFLDSLAGQQYRDLFWQLRLGYVVNHHLDMDMVANDRLLPQSWLQPAITKQWYNMLRITQLKDMGPVDLPLEVFERECSRCGRTLETGEQHIWRWTGYNYNIDLVMIFNGRSFRIRRHSPVGLSNNGNARAANRRVMYRITVVSLDNQRQEVFRQTTGLQSLELGHSADGMQEAILPLETANVRYPLLLSANFLVFTPSTTSPLVLQSQVLASSARPPSYGRGNMDLNKRDKTQKRSTTRNETALRSGKSTTDKKTAQRKLSTNEEQPAYASNNRSNNLDEINANSDNLDPCNRSKRAHNDKSPCNQSTALSVASISATTDSASSEMTSTSSAIPSASSAIPTASSAIPSTSSAIPSASSAITATSSAIPSTSSAIPSTSSANPSTSSAIPSTSSAIPSTSSAIPSTSSAIPSTSSAIPSTSSAIPSTSSPIPSTSSAIPSTSSAIPSTSFEDSDEDIDNEGQRQERVSVENANLNAFSGNLADRVEEWSDYISTEEDEEAEYNVFASPNDYVDRNNGVPNDGIDDVDEEEDDDDDDDDDDYLRLILANRRGRVPRLLLGSMARARAHGLRRRNYGLPRV